MLMFLLVLLAALAFEFINGFHDTANAIATVVGTRVLTARQAILLAGITNLIGAFVGVAVAKTIASGYVDSDVVQVNQATILAAMISGIIWNLVTWRGGIPSSSSHALVGGLCGAVLAQAHGNWNALIWHKEKFAKVTLESGEVVEKTLPFWKHDGLWPKLIVPMLASPVIGLILGYVITFLLTSFIVGCSIRPSRVQGVFGKLQIASAGFMGFAHGKADAQKTMGIVTLALVAATASGAFSDLPAWLQHIHLPEFMHGWTLDVNWLGIHIRCGDSLPLLTSPPRDTDGKPMPPFWVILICAVTMGAGTMAGGWRIIRTLGHKMVKLQPVHGFAAETAAAFILKTSANFGIPLSTTHVITTSIMGVGAMKRFSAVKWGLVHRIVMAWIITLPITIALGYGINWIFLLCGMK